MFFFLQDVAVSNHQEHEDHWKGISTDEHRGGDLEDGNGDKERTN